MACLQCLKLMRQVVEDTQVVDSWLMSKLMAQSMQSNNNNGCLETHISLSGKVAASIWFLVVVFTLLNLIVVQQMEVPSLLLTRPQLQLKSLTSVKMKKETTSLMSLEQRKTRQELLKISQMPIKLISHKFSQQTKIIQRMKSQQSLMKAYMSSFNQETIIWKAQSG